MNKMELLYKLAEKSWPLLICEMHGQSPRARRSIESKESDKVTVGPKLSRQMRTPILQHVDPRQNNDMQFCTRKAIELPETRSRT